MRLLELRRILGAHADRTAMLWDPVYRAIGGQLATLPFSPKAWRPKCRRLPPWPTSL